METYYKNILGWKTDEEAKLLDELALEAPQSKILEIGTFVGKSASILSSAIKGRGILVCIDLFLENQAYWGKPDITIGNTLETFWANMEKLGLSSNIIALKGHSKDILPKLSGKFGMIYIDGGHTIQDVLPNSMWAWEHLLPGGILAWHDCENKKWPDVKLAVETLMKKWGVDFYKTTENKNLVSIRRSA